MAREVTDADVAAALADKKVRDFLEAFRRQYRHQLDPDECESTAYWALHKALRAWDEARAAGCQFSTFVFQTLKWEFDRQAEREARHRQGREPADLRRAPDRRADEERVAAPGKGEVSDYLDRYLPRKQADAFRQYHVLDRSAEEIGGDLGWSAAQVRRNLRAAEARLREVMQIDP